MESEGLSEGQDTLGFSGVKPTGHLKHPAPGPRTFCCQSTTTPAAGPFLICVTVLAKYCSRSSSWAMQSILSTGEGDDGTPPVFRNAWQRSAAAQWRPPPQNRASVLKPSQAGRTNPPGQSSNRLICPPSDGMIQALPGGERGGTARPRFCNPRPPRPPFFRASPRPSGFVPVQSMPLGGWDTYCSRPGTHRRRRRRAAQASCVSRRVAFPQEDPATFIMRWRGRSGGRYSYLARVLLRSIFCTLLVTFHR